MTDGGAQQKTRTPHKDLGNNDGVRFALMRGLGFATVSETIMKIHREANSQTAVLCGLLVFLHRLILPIVFQELWFVLFEQSLQSYNKCDTCVTMC